MSRPFSDESIDTLEQIFTKHRHERVVLAQLREELLFRKTNRAKQLMKEVMGVLSGDVVLPDKPVRASKPEDQIELLGQPKRKAT